MRLIKLSLFFLGVSLFLLLISFYPDFFFLSPTVGYSSILSIITVILSGVVVYKNIQYNYYSLQSAINLGLFLFSFLFMGIDICFAFKTIPGSCVSNFSDFCIIVRCAVICTIPFMLIFSIISIISNCVSNISMRLYSKRKRIKFQGYICSVIIFLSIYLVMFPEKLFLTTKSSWVSLIIYAVFLFGQSIFWSFLILLRYSEKRRPTYDRDFLIVLGCGLNSDGTPSNMLVNRLTAGLIFYHEQLTKTDRLPVFIVSGGKGTHETCSEAESMKAWLLKKGIPESRIIVENRSHSTEENLLFSNNIIKSITTTDYSAAFCTTNFHAFRAGIIARNVGLHAEAITYNTVWYYWYNAAIREIAALIVESIMQLKTDLGKRKKV